MFPYDIFIILSVGLSSDKVVSKHKPSCIPGRDMQNNLGRNLKVCDKIKNDMEHELAILILSCLY